MHPGKALFLVTLGSLLAMVPVIIVFGLFFSSSDYGGGPGYDEGLRFELTFGDDWKNREQLEEERRELAELFDEDLRGVEERFEEERRAIEEAFHEAVGDLNERFDEGFLRHGGQPESPFEPVEPDAPDEPDAPGG